MKQLICGTTAYRTFSNDAAGGRLSHAYMLHFNDVKNLREALKIFALRFFGLTEENGRRILNESFTDCRIFPEEGKKLTADAVAALLADSILKPLECDRKLYIISGFEQTTQLLQNKLLKTLEEPPAHAIFILATTEPQKIPATILSRCMRLDFKLIPTEDLVSHLKSVLGEIGRAYEEEAVVAIARAGAGSDRDMLSIAEMCLAYSEKLTYEGVTTVLGAADFLDTAALCGEILKPDLGAALEKTENILSEGRSVGVLCRDILQILNMVAIAKSCRNAEALLAVSSERFHAVSEIEKFADGRAILRATEL